MVTSFAKQPTISPEDWQQHWVTMVLLVIFMGYSFGSIFFPNMPITPITWALLLTLTLVLVKLRALFPVFLLYFLFLVFYETGLAIDITGNATNTYVRNIFTSAIFSTLLFSIFSGSTRNFKGFQWNRRYADIVALLITFLFAYWSYGGASNLYSGSVHDVREVVTGGYLTLSDTIALFSISYLCKKNIASLEFVAVFSATAFIIFLFGSRTTLAFYPLAVTTLIGRSKSFWSISAWFASGASAIFFWFGEGIETNNPLFFRFNSFLTLVSGGYDESNIVRSELRSEFLDLITDHPVCLLISCHPPEGWYEHSILSVTQYFGIMGLTFLVLSFLIVVFRVKFIVKQWYFPLFVYAYISLLLSRSWTSLVFPVFVAMVLHAALSAKLRNRVSKTRHLHFESEFTQL